MIKRLLSSSLLTCVALTLTACPSGGTDDGIGAGRELYFDEWEQVLVGPAEVLESLNVGDRLTMDNYANRGTIEVNFVEGTDQVTVEMQRFTVAKDAGKAEEAFGRMHPWTYDLSSPEQPSPDLDPDLCFAEEITGCYVRAYYDGQIQPARDGVNFRVTLPVGWEGQLDLTTEDNLEEGNYPARSDVRVIGLAGNLKIDLDSGNVDIKIDPNAQHYAGCGNNDKCEDEDHVPGCGCSEPTNIAIENANSQSSNITVDVGDPDKWYTIQLENTGEFSQGGDFICTASIDCAPFADCLINPDFADLENKEWADINYPGEPAIAGAGFRIVAKSQNCANVDYVDDPENYDLENGMPSLEQRGNLEVCVNCL